MKDLLFLLVIWMIAIAGFNQQPQLVELDLSNKIGLASVTAACLLLSYILGKQKAE